MWKLELGISSSNAQTTGWLKKVWFTMNIFFDLGNEVLYVKVDPFINTFYHITKNMWIEKKLFQITFGKLSEIYVTYHNPKVNELLISEKKITMSGPNAGQMAH